MSELLKAKKFLDDFLITHNAYDEYYANEKIIDTSATFVDAIMFCGFSWSFSSLEWSRLDSLFLSEVHGTPFGNLKLKDVLAVREEELLIEDVLIKIFQKYDIYDEYCKNYTPFIGYIGLHNFIYHLKTLAIRYNRRFEEVANTIEQTCNKFDININTTKVDLNKFKEQQ